MCSGIQNVRDGVGGGFTVKKTCNIILHSICTLSNARTFELFNVWADFSLLLNVKCVANLIYIQYFNTVLSFTVVH